MIPCRWPRSDFSALLVAKGPTLTNPEKVASLGLSASYDLSRVVLPPISYWQTMFPRQPCYCCLVSLTQKVVYKLSLPRLTIDSLGDSPLKQTPHPEDPGWHSRFQHQCATFYYLFFPGGFLPAHLRNKSCLAKATKRCPWRTNLLTA